MLVEHFEKIVQLNLPAQYDEVCSSADQCEKYTNTYDQSVICMLRILGKDNETEQINAGLCSVVSVPTGRCQCARNCGPVNGYFDYGEFDVAEQRCRGFAGSPCYDRWALNDCVENAYCPQNVRKCTCNLGYVESEDGKYYVPSN
ncbi:hypothetical protein Fcan01_06394 [Folsomia candida]|uniref:Uncharacterized protein n=1 Tax=Folsomia candida TaxID=158441 RepID=A0A226EIC0_FOLCA|nr:hypothetical protein Fcan01_06394 [Folsomia candida]